MKTIFLLLAMMGTLLLAAQTPYNQNSAELPVINFNPEITLHIISPEPIQYVDISSPKLVGDLPVDNVLRLKGINDSLLLTASDEAIMTIVGQSYMAQYRLLPTIMSRAQSKVEIEPANMAPLLTKNELTFPQMRQYAFNILALKQSGKQRKVQKNGIAIQLNHVYTIGDYIILDLLFSNSTNLPYTIDQLKFTVEDKKVLKATNLQSVEILPIWKLYGNGSFNKTLRNVYVFKKITFPSDRVLNIELSEQQISGRTISLKVSYKDILNADTL